MEETCDWLDVPTASGDVVLSAVLPGFNQAFQKIVGDLGVSAEIRNTIQSLNSLVSIQV